MLVGGVAGQAASIANAGYIINVGGTYYPDTTKDAFGKETLVHEMTHVWQGKNNVFALTATLASLAAQCRGMSVSGGYKGRSAAYRYTIGTPPPAWGSFNPEQQANIVQQWYNDSQDPTIVSTTTKEWPYVRDYVRQGQDELIVCQSQALPRGSNVHYLSGLSVTGFPVATGSLAFSAPFSKFSKLPYA